MTKLALALVLAVSACGGNDNTQQTMPDAATGAKCAGAIWDSCVNNSDCMSNNCHFYMQQNFTVCTQACSATNPCPNDSSGQPASCNQMGICKPAAPNSCHL